MKRYRFRESQQWTAAVLFFCLLMVATEGTLGSAEAGKISRVLREEVAFLSANPKYDYPVPVIVQVNPGFFQRSQTNRRGRGLDVDNSLSLVHGYRSRLKAAQIRLLLRSPIVEYVTLDAVIRDSGKRPWEKVAEKSGTGESPQEPAERDNPIGGGGLDSLGGSGSGGDDSGEGTFIGFTGSTTVNPAGAMGGDSGGNGLPDNLDLGDLEKGNPNEFLVPTGAKFSHKLSNGTRGNLSVAVFDSGIASHPNAPGTIVAVVDFTGESPKELPASSAQDLYGHGTAVAGIIAASGNTDADWVGVAPGALLVDVRVINGQGFGQTSKLIQAMDWVIQNRQRFNIRVANLSLGHPPLESYTMDPLCQAADGSGRHRHRGFGRKPRKNG